MSGYRPRVIPVLLLQDGGLVKSRAFKEHRYLGDPLNAVRIFNDLQADELMFLDITATRQGRTVSPELVASIGAEACMPFAVGGGIASLEQIGALLAAGAERVVLGSVAAERPDFVAEASLRFGASTLAVCLDVAKPFFGGSRVYTRNGSRKSAHDPVAFARLMQQQGAGELIVQSIAHDGQRQGYDTLLIRQVCDAVTIPVTGLGGAGEMAHLRALRAAAPVSGLAAGSLFVFHGLRQGVLLNYPERHTLGQELAL